MGRWLFVLALALTGCDDCTTDKGGGGGSTCCKVCKAGSSKPCGDSCIGTSQTCSKGAGCACYGVAPGTIEVPRELLLFDDL